MFFGARVLNYIKFWIAKELAGLMIFLIIMAVVLLICGTLYVVDFFQRRSRRRKP